MVIDHITVAVSNFETSMAFYSKALAPLGIKLITQDKGWAGFGRGARAQFWFGPDHRVQHPMHIAFLADSRADVDRFYQAALDAGGKDNGKPGLREIYHPHYYGAFVLDPDGHNIEAVCHHIENTRSQTNQT